MSSSLAKVDFINFYPTVAVSADLKKRVHAHAARQGHAKSRRVHNTKYGAREAQRVSRADENVAIEKSIPSPNPLSLLASSRKDPFVSSIMRLTERECFLLDHYVVTVLPCLRVHCPVLKPAVKHYERMTKAWVQAALTDVGLMSGILLGAARHLSVLYRPQHQKRRHYLQLAITYKLICLRAVTKSISAQVSKIGDVTLASVLSLVIDEIALEDLATARLHVQAAGKMVELNGGFDHLGLDGILSYLLYKYVVVMRILDESGPPPCGEGFMAGSESY